ncbi:hypothetical protein LTR64_006024 [Lithohypha guttulata]|uniref:Uncharacterized protein n=1 Tax=Lithohypha guttulata TaxID=1690604 RepID=A0AAN7T732_9EURO|nr:hypothetical protein LTR51_002178 [Lithohypha guttulata]KAK5090096.1 hypothetical protein LTR05_000265 [Lithohypha guttulata]
MTGKSALGSLLARKRKSNKVSPESMSATDKAVETIYTKEELDSASHHKADEPEAPFAVEEVHPSPEQWLRCLQQQAAVDYQSRIDEWVAAQQAIIGPAGSEEGYMRIPQWQPDGRLKRADAKFRGTYGWQTGSFSQPA